MTLISLPLPISQPLPNVWAYFLLAVMVAVEGPAATLVAAWASSNNLLNPVVVFFAASAGNLLADILWYTLGYLGKLEWLERIGSLVGLRHSTVRRLESTIESNAPRLIFIAKLTLGFVIPVLVATGMARVPIKRWLPVLLIGETLWTGALVVVGFTLGKYLQTLKMGLQIITVAGGVVFLVILINIINQKRKKKFDSEE
jgi:membrane protein DedA with SNARE-associated domain